MFFDSYLDDKRLYSSGDFAKYMRLFYADGVVMHQTNAESLKVYKGTSDLSVSINPGAAIIRGYSYFNDYEPLHKAPLGADASYPRIDRVILRLSLTQRSVSADIKPGTAASTPLPPPLTRNENEYELSLAQLYIPANSAVIEKVTDERYDATVCGIAAGLYTLDMEDYRKQMEDTLDWLSQNAGYSNPNLLLDSHFKVWEDGDSFSDISAQGQYTATMWSVVNISGVAGLSVSKAQNGMRLAFGGSGEQVVMVTQQMEQADKAALDGQTVTLSWSVDGTIYQRTTLFQASANNPVELFVKGEGGSEAVLNWVKLELGATRTRCMPRPFVEERNATLRYFKKIDSAVRNYAYGSLPSGGWKAFYNYNYEELVKKPQLLDAEEKNFVIMDSTNNTPVMEAQAASIHVVSQRNLTLEYDAKDHTYLIPQKPIRLDARDAANPLPTIAVYSVQGPNTAKKDEPITFTVVTSLNTANIRLYNDNGTVLSPSSQTVTSNTDGTKTYTFIVSLGSPGNRTLEFRAAGADGIYFVPGFPVNIKITNS